MASGSDIHDENEITGTNNLFTSVLTLTSPQLPTLPIDVIQEIFCRLPVKLLLQLRCVCRSWNALISDSKFIKKHCRMSTTRRIHFLTYLNCPHNKYCLTSYALDSIFTDLTTVFTQIEYSPNTYIEDPHWTLFYHFVGSCNGILCFADDHFDSGLVILWNPSIRNFKELPLVTKLQEFFLKVHMTFGFGYDSTTDKYKVVCILDYLMPDWIKKIEVKVHTLGTDIWRSIQGYPFDGVPVYSSAPGIFVNGTINWMVSNEYNWRIPNFIVSFDLVNESYQKILPQIGGVDMCELCALGVLRDCLSVTYGNDVWIMEEYGNKESWTKLFTIPYIREPNYNSHIAIMPIYIFEDDQVIVKFIGDLVLYMALYDPKSGTLKPTNFQHTNFVNIPEICVESLISPCSLC